MASRSYHLSSKTPPPGNRPQVGEMQPPAEENEGFKKAKKNRIKLAARLRAEGADNLAQRLELCGSEMTLECSCCGRRKKVEVRCERRWCPVCQRAIAAERVARYQFAAARMEWPLFVTLTIQNSTEAWEGIKRLKSAWGKLRRTKWFRACGVRGGVTAIEITNRGNGWHPHLHSLIDCRWLAVSTPPPQRGATAAVIRSRCQAAKRELDEAWAICTRQPTASTFVKRQQSDNLVEVLKYCADPGTLLDTEGSVGELIRAIDKFRMVQPFGSCMGIGREIRELARLARPPKRCDYCATFPDVDRNTYWKKLSVRPRYDHGDVDVVFASQLGLDL